MPTRSTCRGWIERPAYAESQGWISIDEHQPADGQKVEVKTLLGVEGTATFRTVPTMHWRNPAVSLDSFPFWRPLGS
jgi:hypothetical protein